MMAFHNNRQEEMSTKSSRMTSQKPLLTSLSHLFILMTLTSHVFVHGDTLGYQQLQGLDELERTEEDDEMAAQYHGILLAKYPSVLSETSIIRVFKLFEDSHALTFGRHDFQTLTRDWNVSDENFRDIGV